jgi:hypothetical protein
MAAGGRAGRGYGPKVVGPTEIQSGRPEVLVLATSRAVSRGNVSSAVRPLVPQKRSGLNLESSTVYSWSCSLTLITAMG